MICKITHKCLFIRPKYNITCLYDQIIRPFIIKSSEKCLVCYINDSLNNYDKIEFYLSTQGAFEFHSNQGYEYMPNYSGILADNDGWESSYWELFYWIKKDNSTNLFIFSEKNDMNALNVHQVFRITNKSFHVLFRKPFEIVKVLPKGEVVNLFVVLLGI
jgi:hypothetical protein